MGILSYSKAHEIQIKLHSLRSEDRIPDTLIFVEHSHVLTRGRAGREDNLLASREFLAAKGVEIFDVERGGDYTYHGPGQLVGYPIFRLDRGLADIRWFIGALEGVIKAGLSDFGIETKGSQEMEKGSPVGVWAGDNKLAALGIAVKNKVSFHGFALNVNTDLAMFGLIIPCGLADKGVTSMKNILGREIPMDQVKAALRKAAEARFDFSLEDKSWEDVIG